jgi:hypothetical protein
MALKELKLAPCDMPMPGDVRRFVREAQRRIDRFQRSARIPGFVPSDFVAAYRVLRALAAADRTSGKLFCEWGSGFGVVTCLAAMLDFDAIGIEIEGELVDEARRLADDFGLPVEFIHDSFIPPHGDVWRHADGRFAWLTLDCARSQEGGLSAEAFDIIFAYPWPDEERWTTQLFDRFGGVGALFVTYHGGEAFRLHRKTGNRAAAGRILAPPASPSSFPIGP